MTCAPEPPVDPAATLTDVDLFGLLTLVLDAGADCRNKLGRVREEILRAPPKTMGAPGAPGAGM